MKFKKHTQLSAAMAFSLFALNAFAASDNTIRFQGEVTDETCSVSINGDQASPIVLLPTVSTKDLGSSGDTAGQATFDISLSGCSGDTQNDTKISTVFVGNQVSSNGNLSNTGTAENVEVQILDTTDKVINFTENFKGDGDLTLKANSSEASSTYTAQYYSTGQATPGSVEASLQYAISYD